ncbi:SH3 domain-containing protein [Sorangium sp. So ce1036]|uniref:SH3 domain-containing protein n=1 Tax=Sorangium sp. So ce1036 TaxID=3133328 RepID=UPI003F060DDA
MVDPPAGQDASPGPRDTRAPPADAGPAAAPPADARRAGARAQPSSAAPDAAPAPGRARRLDRLTGLLLLLAAAIVLFPAAPALLRAAGVGGTRSPMPSASRFAHLLDRRSPAAPRFRFDEGADTDDRPSPGAELPGLDDEGEEPGTTGRLQLGIAARGITLRDEPRADGSRVGAIAAGEFVMIVREAGGWALVAQHHGDSLVMGWARRSEIAVR